MELDKIRELAGLSVLSEGKKKKLPADDVPLDGAADPDVEGEEEIPAIVLSIAGKVEGKKGDDVIALIHKVYKAGHKDGKAAAKAEQK